jgi:hypothetical protein
MRIGMDRVLASDRDPSTGNAPGFGFRTRRTALAVAAVAFLFPATFLTGCSSSGSSGGSADGDAKPGQPTEIRYRAVTANTSFGLVNESHTPRTELYSSRLPIDAATTKVSTDEVVAATVDYFREQGFFDMAQPGPMPSPAPPGVSQMLGVTTPAGSVHMALRPGATKAQALCFQTCAKALLDIYNNTVQLQAVDQAPDWKTNKPPQPGIQPRKGG